jgi:predicted aspartyl protease
MSRPTRPARPVRLCVSALWQGVIGFLVFLFLSEGRLWAQTTIYTWTDERGVAHYSDSMVPAQHHESAEKVVMPSRSASQTARSGGSGNIPLVILNDDSSQKFVWTVLEGERTTREVLMLVDTGAQITLIDETLAQELDLEHVQDALLGGVTGTARGWIGRLPTLRLGGEAVTDLHVMVGPLPGRLLLGMDVLERLELSVSPRSLHRNR